MQITFIFWHNCVNRGARNACTKKSVKINCCRIEELFKLPHNKENHGMEYSVVALAQPDFLNKKLATQHMVGFLGKGLLVDPTPKKSDLLRLTNDF